MSAKKNKFKRGMMTFLAVFLGLILTGMLGVTYFAESYLNQINRVDDVPQVTMSSDEEEILLAETDPVEDEEPDSDVIELAPEEVTLPEEPVEVIEKPDSVVNILLIGQDRRPGEGRQRSDAMILCSIDTDKKTLVMTSFLRDTYVQLPDYNGKRYGMNRLNVPYAVGGMPMLDECILMNFGVEIDHNIEVDFSGFEKIVNAMGGVEVELTKAESGKVDGARSGLNVLNGAQALQYARIRKLDSDFGRTNRQRTILLAMIEKAKTLSLNELLTLTETIFPMITTDMSNGDIIGYVMDFFPLLLDLQITSQTAPMEGEYQSARIDGRSVLVPDLEAINARLRETIGS